MPISQVASLVDFAGTLLIAVSVGRTVIRFVRAGGSPTVVDQLRFSIAADLVTALSLKSGAGIIRTLTVATWPQFLMVLTIIALRFFLGQTLKGIARRNADTSA